ncbi:MAG: panC [Bacillales bacterium]|jgi:pantoate--beta-alanine ligase|nr:panC [Bacillales bacterium]
MKKIQVSRELYDELTILKLMGKSIGFVPTMGYLHEGHIELIKQARVQNDIVVLSIFVNPLQFGPNEDFDTYPRDILRDESIANENGVDYLFYPSVNEMYPSKPTVTAVVNNKTDVLCGKTRPGHFDGVVTVVTKLFNIVQPTRAYFGLKDAQQVAIIHSLISDFNFPIELVEVPTVREDDGLAKSSRNVYLNEDERIEAIEISRSLNKAKMMIENGQYNITVIKNEITKCLNKTSGIIDYVEIYSYPELNEIKLIQGKIIIAIALKFSKARLIDNLIYRLN